MTDDNATASDALYATDTDVPVVCVAVMLADELGLVASARVVVGGLI